MTSDATHEEAVSLLQELGLKEYEAKCFVGLSRMTSGTAKGLSEVTEVPRTRVYDAVRILEAKGLVEVQHSSPQQFRAVPLSEATETLRTQYEDRVERLQSTLREMGSIESEDEEAELQEVWSLSGSDAIENRAAAIIEDATDEVVLVIGTEAVLSESLIEELNSLDPDIELIVGSGSASIRDRVEQQIPRATAFLSELGWLHGELTPAEDAAVGRLLLVDRSTLLVSSIDPQTSDEQAIFATGLRNGLIVIARRLLSQGVMEMTPLEQD
ncbi:Sugar-specific transcriptional regulator TrmB [Haloarcula vallismortis]|uniref:Sugar-specific transcriptional regulator TrmB n=2 Tax=Haloarcula vallismortis TaxID=28442 RepID=A0A1H2QQG9_HALVA|nr:helix-turn-helix domain-containing protein [Haloarcula vallismortis]SDW09335.1 Sugar-specific transcriptional regulator TrmB [Haloarcula vallismortis]